MLSVLHHDDAAAVVAAKGHARIKPANHHDPQSDGNVTHRSRSFLDNAAYTENTSNATMKRDPFHKRKQRHLTEQKHPSPAASADVRNNIFSGKTDKKPPSQQVPVPQPQPGKKSVNTAGGGKSNKQPKSQPSSASSSSSRPTVAKTTGGSKSKKHPSGTTTPGPTPIPTGKSGKGGGGGAKSTKKPTAATGGKTGKKMPGPVRVLPCQSSFFSLSANNTLNRPYNLTSFDFYTNAIVFTRRLHHLPSNK